MQQKKKNLKKKIKKKKSILFHLKFIKNDETRSQFGSWILWIFTLLQ